MCSAFFSDRINGTEVNDSLKGIGGIIPLFFCFIFFFWLFYSNLSYMNFFLWGAAVSYMLSLFIFVPPSLQDMADGENLREAETLFSQLISGGVGRFVGAYSFSGFSQHPLVIIFLKLGVAFYALFQGSRGSFLLGIVGCFVLIYFVKYAKSKYLPDWIQCKIKKRLPLFIMSIVIGGILAKNIYEFTAKNGYLGEANKVKYERQSSSKIGLLSGRGEFVSAFLAISDKPWLGHGSYAIDEEGYAVEAAVLTNEEELDFIINKKGERQIPAHSHLTFAWIWHGIIGGVFWMYTLYLIFLFLYKYIYVYPRYIGYLLPACLGIMWQILFSPFQGRPMLGAFFAFIIVMMNQIDSSYRQIGKEQLTEND